MFIIATDTAFDAALTSSLPDNIKRLLTLRREQLLQDTGAEYRLDELANWIVVAKGDPLAKIETAANYPITPDPPWEWVLDHGGIFEAPIILSDDGFGIVLIVPDQPGVDPLLLSMLRRDAQRADGISG